MKTLNLINKALLLEQLKRYWAIGAIALLGYILVVFLPVFAPFRDTQEFTWNQQRNLIHLLELRHPFMVFMTILAPLCSALALFGFANNGPSTTAFHSFPINKKQLFCTNMLAGGILLLVPLLLLSLMMLFPARITLWDWGATAEYPYMPSEIGLYTVNTVPRIFAFFLRVSLSLIFYFAFFALAASMSGIKFVAGLLSFAIPLLPAGGMLLAALATHFYIFGVEPSFISNDVFGNLILYTNPFFWFTDLTDAIATTDGW